MRSSVYAVAIAALGRCLMSYYSILFILSVFISIRYLTKRYHFVRGLSWIPGPPGIPIFGNSLSLLGGQDDFFRLMLKCVKEYGPIFKLWIGMRPFVFISNAEAVQTILTSNIHIDKSYEYNFLHSWIGTGLLTATGSKWHSRRKLLTPTFHYSILEDFIEPVIQQSRILTKRLKKNVNGPVFNVVKYTKLLALDIVCVTSMGQSVDAQEKEENEYVKAIEGVSEILQRRFITPWLKPELLFGLTSMGRRHDKYVKTINDFVRKVIKDKKTERKLNSVGDYTDSKNRKRRAFLDLLLDTAEDGKVLTDDDVREEVNTIMFAGHDSTSVALGWCLYVLGKHHHVQEKILQEYNEVVKNETPTYREIQQLQYLERCIKETMRLYPVVPLIARDIKHEIEISKNKMLLPGVTALVVSPSLHRDPFHFPNPDEFCPDRFSVDNNESRSPFAYIPFSAGPRNCIGSKFAMMTVKLVLHEILKNFEVTSIDSEQDLNLFSEIVLSNKGGVRITLRGRNADN